MVKITTKNLEQILCRFDVNDLKEFVFPVFPEITWQEAKKIIVNKTSTMTIKSFALVMSKALSSLDENSIKKRIGILTLIEASLQSTKTKRRWTCYQMLTNSNETRDYTQEAMKRAVEQHCKIAGIHVISKVLLYDSMFWIMIMVKKIVRGSGLVLQRPLLFAFSSSDSYLLAGQKQMSKDILLALTKALMYENIKNSFLDGRRISELFRVLKIKGRSGLDDSSVPIRLTKPTFKPAKHILDGDTVQNENKAYAETIFGKNPPVIDKLTLNAPDCPWETDLMNGKKLDMTVTITAPNVCQFLTSLAEHGVLKRPFPPYMEGIVRSGKNFINLRPQKN